MPEAVFQFSPSPTCKECGDCAEFCEADAPPRMQVTIDGVDYILIRVQGVDEDECCVWTLDVETNIFGCDLDNLTLKGCGVDACEWILTAYEGATAKWVWAYSQPSCPLDCFATRTLTAAATGSCGTPDEDATLAPATECCPCDEGSSATLNCPFCTDNPRSQVSVFISLVTSSSCAGGGGNCTTFNGTWILDQLSVDPVSWECIWELDVGLPCGFNRMRVTVNDTGPNAAVTLQIIDDVTPCTLTFENVVAYPVTCEGHLVAVGGPIAGPACDCFGAFVTATKTVTWL